MNTLAFFLGATVGAFLLSRLFWVLSWWWPLTLLKAVTINLLSGAVAVIIAGLGHADGGPARFEEMAPIYLAAQLLVAAFDLWTTHRKLALLGPPPDDPYYSEIRGPQVTNEPNMRLKRQGHRLGVFVTVASLLLTLASFPAATGYGAPAWASALFTAGIVGVLFGYLLARLWFWFKAA